MIVFIEPHQRLRHTIALNQYFSLRKIVFCDKLKWVDAKPSGLEHDDFDDIYNLYILNIDDISGDVTGGVRLMPTTGPTLMHTVWADMLPDPEDFRSPNIWEATRFCVETQASRKQSFANRITLALTLAVMDFARANGISHIIAVCESKFFDMTMAYGDNAEIIDRRIDDKGTEICCGLWSADADRGNLAWAKQFIGGVEPVIVQKVA
jgi:N-acyl-L-homoserine lactone synthetase